jgi:hypothetical protein
MGQGGCIYLLRYDFQSANDFINVLFTQYVLVLPFQNVGWRL